VQTVLEVPGLWVRSVQLVGRPRDIRRNVGRVRVGAAAAEEHPASVELPADGLESALPRLAQSPPLRVVPEAVLLIDQRVDAIENRALVHLAKCKPVRKVSETRTMSLVDFARDLVAIPTENPPGAAYDECVQRICAELDSLAIEYDVIETGDEETRRQAILATVGESGPLLYLHGHYDVVPAFVPEQFDPRVEDGRLIGRGASDMKGGLAAIVHAARPAAEADARIGLVIVPDEETGGRLGAEQLAGLGRLDRGAAGAIVAEPTWGTIWHACRGAFTLRVRVRGRPAHVGLHYEGVNAFAAAVEVAGTLSELGQSLRGRRSGLEFASPNERARESIMLVGGVSGGGTNFNIVPAEFSFTVDRRPNPEEDYDEAKQELLDLLASARNDGFELDWEVLQDAPSAVTPAGSDFVRAVAGAVTAVTGTTPTVTCCPGVLETRVYDQLGIPAVAFGPGLIERMHGPDEDVPISNLVDAAAIYAELAGALALASAHGR
jgi:succinyl-diaminopimelate desuccinylase